MCACVRVCACVCVCVCVCIYCSSFLLKKKEEEEEEEEERKKERIEEEQKERKKEEEERERERKEKETKVQCNILRLSHAGQVGITLDTEWYEPKAPGQAYSDASSNALTFRLGIFADPLFKGDYPDLVKTTLQEKATRLGLLSSPLQTFSAQEKRENTGG